MREPHEVPEEGAPLFGRNPVLELLRTGSRRVEEIAIISEGRGPALHELLALAGGFEPPTHCLQGSCSTT